MLSKFFRREKGGILGFSEIICEACSAYQPTRYEKRIAVGIAISQIWWFVPIFQSSRYAAGGGFFLIFMAISSLVTLPLRIVIHEAGHAIAAQLVGEDVALITIGRGPSVFTKRFFGVKIEFRRYAYAGGMMYHFRKTGRASRWAKALVLIGGPGANALAAILMFFLSFCSILSSDPSPVLMIFSALFAGAALAQAFTAVFNLIPRKLGDDETVNSDGAQLLELLRGPRQVSADGERAWRAMSYGLAERFEESAMASSDVFQNAKSPAISLIFMAKTIHAVSRSQGDQAALQYYFDHKERFDQILASSSEDLSSEKAWIDANVAWSALKTAASEYSNFAREFSESALAMASNISEIMGTRGAWLIDANQTDEGLRLMTAAVRGVSDIQDKPISVFFWRRVGGPKATPREVKPIRICGLTF